MILWPDSQRQQGDALQIPKSHKDLWSLCMKGLVTTSDAPNPGSESQVGHSLGRDIPVTARTQTLQSCLCVTFSAWRGQMERLKDQGETMKNWRQRQVMESKEEQCEWQCWSQVRSEQEIEKEHFESLAGKKRHKSKGEWGFRWAVRAGGWKELESIPIQRQILSPPTAPGMSWLQDTRLTLLTGPLTGPGSKTGVVWPQ